MPNVFIIILNWNGYQDTAECLRSVRRLTYPSCKVIVVDNGSSDGSVAKLKEEFKEVFYIENKENLGFATGNNVGISYALEYGADYVLLLNNDTLVEPDSLDILVEVAERNPSAGVLGPKVLCYPDTHLVYSRGESYSLWFNMRTIDIGEVDQGKETLPRRVDYVVGCAMLVSKKFIEEVGLLDETFFAYFEEIDWCFRGRKNGFDILYVPGAIIYHRGSVSTGGEFSPLSSYYRTRNWIYFMRKHAMVYHWVTFVPVFIYVFMRRFLRAILRMDVLVMKSLCRAITWNLRMGR